MEQITQSPKPVSRLKLFTLFALYFLVSIIFNSICFAGWALPFMLMANAIFYGIILLVLFIGFSIFGKKGFLLNYRVLLFAIFFQVLFFFLSFGSAVGDNGASSSFLILFLSSKFGANHSYLFSTLNQIASLSIPLYVLSLVIFIVQAFSSLSRKN